MLIALGEGLEKLVCFFLQRYGPYKEDGKGRLLQVTNIFQGMTKMIYQAVVDKHNVFQGFVTTKMGGVAGLKDLRRKARLLNLKVYGVRFKSATPNTKY